MKNLISNYDCLRMTTRVFPPQKESDLKMFGGINYFKQEITNISKSKLSLQKIEIEIKTGSFIFILP